MPLPVSNLAGMLPGMEKGKITPVSGDPGLELMFNPEKLTISRSSQWKTWASLNPRNGSPSLVGGAGSGGTSAAVPMGAATAPTSSALGKETPGPGEVVAGYTRNRYLRSEPATLSMSVHFNDSFGVTGGVSKQIALLESWMHIPKGEDNPPLLEFTWGKIGFVGYLKNLNVDFRHFGPDGSPIHAMANVQMVEEPQTSGPGNPTSGGPPGRRTRRVGAGDSLQSIAYQEYGTPTVWRRLAEANGIDDPLRLRMGAELLVPLPGEALA